MSKMSKIRIEAEEKNPGQSRITIDGVEPNFVSEVTLVHRAGSPATLVLKSFPASHLIEGDAQVTMITVCPSCRREVVKENGEWKRAVRCHVEPYVAPNPLPVARSPVGALLTTDSQGVMFYAANMPESGTFLNGQTYIEDGKTYTYERSSLFSTALWTARGRDAGSGHAAG